MANLRLDLFYPIYQPLFPGESAVDQLVEIIKVLCLSILLYFYYEEIFLLLLYFHELNEIALLAGSWYSNT